MKQFEDEKQLFKYCPSCDIIYPYPDIMFYINRKKNDGLTCWCKNCHTEYERSEAGVVKNKRWRNSESGKLYKQQCDKQWRKRNLGYSTKWAKNNSEKKNIQNKEWRVNNPDYMKKWRNTENGKTSRRKSHNRRRRNLGFIPIMNNPFPPEIRVDYHHINDMLVIPIPHLTHMNTLGNNHRKKCNEILLKYYGLDVENLLRG